MASDEVAKEEIQENAGWYEQYKLNSIFEARRGMLSAVRRKEDDDEHVK